MPGFQQQLIDVEFGDAGFNAFPAEFRGKVIGSVQHEACTTIQCAEDLMKPAFSGSITVQSFNQGCSHRSKSS